MNVWKNKPELLEKVTLKALPDEYKKALNSGEIGLQDIPDDVMHRAMVKGTEDYLACLTSATYDYVTKYRVYVFDRGRGHSSDFAHNINTVLEGLRERGRVEIKVEPYVS
jgi:hypothetical protein